MTTAPNIDFERARFEDFWRYTRGPSKATRSLVRAADGTYSFDSTQRHWITWQHAAGANAWLASRQPQVDNPVAEHPVAAKWRKMLADVGGLENSLVGVPAGGVVKMLDELSALLVQVETPEQRAKRLPGMQGTPHTSGYVQRVDTLPKGLDWSDQPLTRCAANRDGDCTHSSCPQAANYQSTCPLWIDPEES